jgi:hypothetical protein
MFKSLSKFKSKHDANACASHRRARGVCIECGWSKPLAASDLCAPRTVATSIDEPTPETTVGDGSATAPFKPTPFRPRRKKLYWPAEQRRSL